MKLQRLFFSALLCVTAAFLLLLATPTQAQAATKGYYTYSVSGGKATITEVDTSISGNVVIPNTLGGYPVTSIGKYAFEGCISLTSITIPESVTSIGDGAFHSCTSLTSITIPDSVTSIGAGAFAYCNSLTYTTYDNGKYLGNPENPYVVLMDTASNAITSFTISNNTKVIYFTAFKDCVSLTSITIPDSVTSIGEDAFSSCDSLTSVTIGNGVTSIGKYAFEGCISLTSITIPDSVTSIGEAAFYSCTNLTSITIPDSVTSIGYYAFHYCNRLNTVYYSGSQSQWSQISIGSGNSDLTSATIHYNHMHDYTVLPVTTVEATCTEDGYREYTCVHGESYRETMVALRHDYNGTVITVQPSCTEQGYTSTQCTRCDSVQRTAFTNPIGHKMEIIPAIPATCTQTGLTDGSACERCGTVGAAQTETPSLGHNYTENICTLCNHNYGDLDGNEIVNLDDVVTLLLHVSMQEQFPVDAETDFDGNGVEDIDDVFALLLHISMPDKFPLQPAKKEEL